MQAVKEGRLRPSALQPDERMRRPGLSTLVLDEADLMLSMPGYEEDLQAIAPLVRHPRQLTDLRLLQQRHHCRPSGVSFLGSCQEHLRWQANAHHIASRSPTRHQARPHHGEQDCK